MNRYEKIEQVKETYRANIPQPEPSWPPKVRRAVLFIIVHLFDDRLTVGWLKQQCRINGHNFSSRFAYYLNKTPKQYILYYRIETAKKLLMDESLVDAHLSRIAFSLGFNSHSAFDMGFKKQKGCTPGEFRSIYGVL